MSERNPTKPTVNLRHDEVTVQQAKRDPVPGTIFRNEKNVRGVVIAGRSPHNKPLALLDCSVPNCTATHERESSDWHHCHRCAAHMRERTAKPRPSDARSSAPLQAPARVASPSVPGDASEVDEASLLAQVRGYRRDDANPTQFDCYAFADYRGDRADTHRR